jgi:transposase
MEKDIQREVAREAKAMTRQQVILRAITGKINWLQAADIIGVTARHARRLRDRFEKGGLEELRDGRRGRFMRARIASPVIREVCRLKEEDYPDFSVKHFFEYVVEKRGIPISYSWTKKVLQDAGVVKKAPGRGRHLRRRERRPMRGMLLHIDGSTHEWIAGLPKWDLIVVLDDADGRILYARFFEQEGTMSTFSALAHVLQRYGRFCELYHDRGSHFGLTSKAGQAPDEEQNGQVSRALKALGVRQIFARSPEARGRSERAFGTIQGRLPQELRVKGIRDYEGANTYLDQTFVPDFNRRFTVESAQAESAFTPLVGVDLTLLLSGHHERVVRNDNTVTYLNTILQIPPSKDRCHFVRCPVTVHEFPDLTLGVSYQGRLLGHYLGDGKIISFSQKRKNKSQKKQAA